MVNSSSITSSSSVSVHKKSKKDKKSKKEKKNKKEKKSKKEKKAKKVRGAKDGRSVATACAMTNIPSRRFACNPLARRFIPRSALRFSHFRRRRRKRAKRTRRDGGRRVRTRAWRRRKIPAEGA